MLIYSKQHSCLKLAILFFVIPFYYGSGSAKAKSYGSYGSVGTGKIFGYQNHSLV